MIDNQHWNPNDIKLTVGSSEIEGVIANDPVFSFDSIRKDPCYIKREQLCAGFDDYKIEGFIDGKDIFMNFYAHDFVGFEFGKYIFDWCGHKISISFKDNVDMSYVTGKRAPRGMRKFK